MADFNGSDSYGDLRDRFGDIPDWRMHTLQELQEYEDSVLEAQEADVRWRPQFWPWAAKLTVTTQPTLLPPEAVVNLFNWAGAFIGVGEDRPGKSGGDWGRFHVSTDEPDFEEGG